MYGVSERVGTVMVTVPHLVNGRVSRKKISCLYNSKEQVSKKILGHVSAKLCSKTV